MRVKIGRGGPTRYIPEIGRVGVCVRALFPPEKNHHQSSGNVDKMREHIFSACDWKKRTAGYTLAATSSDDVGLVPNETRTRETKFGT